MRKTRKNLIELLRRTVNDSDVLEIMGEDEKGSKSLIYVRDRYTRSMIVLWVMCYRIYIKLNDNDPISFSTGQTEDALAYLNGLTSVAV